MKKDTPNKISKYCKKLVSNRTRCAKCGKEFTVCIMSDDYDYENLNPYYIKSKSFVKRKAKYSKSLLNIKLKSKLKRAKGITNPHPTTKKYKILSMCYDCERYDTYRGASSITMVDKFKR